MWAACQTRPDLSFDSLELSMEKIQATVNTMKKANKAIRKLKNFKTKDLGIFFPRLGRKESLKLLVYGDASFCNLPDGISSAEGYMIFITGKTENCS